MGKPRLPVYEEPNPKIMTRKPPLQEARVRAAAYGIRLQRANIDPQRGYLWQAPCLLVPLKCSEAQASIALDHAMQRITVREVRV